MRSTSVLGSASSVAVLCLNFLVVLVFAGALIPPALAQTVATWSGGAGNWAPCPQDGGNALWDTCSNDIYPDGNYIAVIQGGPVTLASGNGISVVGLNLAASDSLIVTPGYLDITGTNIVNNGAISIGSGDGLGLTGQGMTVTLSGSGTVNLTGQNSFFSGTSGSSPVLINQQTIFGQGSLGHEGFSITNQGTINASGGLLTVQPDSTGITNTGTMEASRGATLLIVYGFLGPFNNKGGTVKALDGGIVQLQGEIYTGGTLTTVGSGVIQLSGGTVLNNLTNSGLVQVSSDSAVLQNTITNRGTIQLLSGTLNMSGNAILTGSGTLIMSGSSVLRQNSSTDTLTNKQLIHGAGTIFELPVTNQGTIAADNTSAPLYFAGDPITNTAIVEASGGGTLQIYENTIVNNKGGTVQALDGSTVILGATINGGILKTTGSGTIQSQNGTLDGTVNVPTNAGMFVVPTPYNLTMQGTINNTGTIAMNGNGCIVVAQPATLTGSGTLTMEANNCIYGQGIAFTNNSTIAGSGSIGDSNPMPITNDGTIHANQTSPLVIRPDNTGFTNNGKLIVDAGSVMTINGLFNNFSGTTLTGGTYSMSGTLGVDNATIVTNAASLTLTGASAELLNTSSNQNALASLALNSTRGVLSLQQGQLLTAGKKFTNKGVVTVGVSSGLTVGTSYTQAAGSTTVDGTLTAPALITQRGSLVGRGALAAAVTSNAIITAGDSATKPGILSVTGTYSQNASGILNISIAGTTVGTQYSQLAVSNGASLNGTLNIKLIKGFVPKIDSTFTILTGSAVRGKFATVNGLKINSSEHFEINYGGTSVTLKVVSGG